MAVVAAVAAFAVAAGVGTVVAFAVAGVGIVAAEAGIVVAAVDTVARTQAGIAAVAVADVWVAIADEVGTELDAVETFVTLAAQLFWQVAVRASGDSHSTEIGFGDVQDPILGFCYCRWWASSGVVARALVLRRCFRWSAEVAPWIEPQARFGRRLIDSLLLLPPPLPHIDLPRCHW